MLREGVDLDCSMDARDQQSKGPLDALQAPWRLAYLESLDESAPKSESSSCFLAEYWASPGDDEKNHVIVRGGHGMVLLNAFPYANGHLLVALGEGRPTLLDYEPSQRAELWKLVELAADLMQRTLEPQAESGAGCGGWCAAALACASGAALGRRCELHGRGWGCARDSIIA